MDCLDARLLVESVLADRGQMDEDDLAEFQAACDHVHICGCEGCRETVDQLAGFQTTTVA